jgi:hypothetical protein
MYGAFTGVYITRMRKGRRCLQRSNFFTTDITGMLGFLEFEMEGTSSDISFYKPAGGSPFIRLTLEIQSHKYKNTD